MDGFEKMDLQSTSDDSKIPSQAPVNPEEKAVVTKKRSMNFKSKKLGFPIIIVLLVFLLLLFGLILPGLKTYSSYKKTYAQAKVFSQVLKKQDINQASIELQKTKDDLADTQKSLHGMFLGPFIPFVNTYYNDADHGMKAASHGLDAAGVAIDSVKPYADLLGLKGQGSFVGGTAQQRIQTTVQAMEKITPRIDDVAQNLNLAKQEIDYINPNDFPAFIDGGKTRSQIASLKKLADDGVVFITEAKPLIKTLPALLGEPNSKKYLVLFQNDKELRPTGGFITAYAIFNVKDGVITVDTSNDIYTLDNTISGKSKAPAILSKYLPLVPQFNLRDSNLSPDFPTSMATFMSMYKKAGGYKPVDGIIAVDTSALVAAMNILGDINVGGVTYSTKTDPRCNCPQVIYQLEQYADQPVEFQRSNRKGIIGDLMFAIMDKAFKSSPKLYWGPLMQAAFTEIGDKHILFNLSDQQAQQGINAVNAGGKIMEFDGDYFHINEANFGGAKANLYTSEAVDQKYDIASDGTITKTVTVNYNNPYKPSDCNLEHGQLCLNAPLRDYFRIYVPKGSKLTDYKGSEVKMTSYEDLGKTVFDGFVTIRPLGTKTFTVTYTLPFKLSKGSPLPLMIQKQPGTQGNEYTIESGAKKLYDEPLNSDVTLKLSL